MTPQKNLPGRRRTTSQQSLVIPSWLVMSVTIAMLSIPIATAFQSCLFSSQRQISPHKLLRTLPYRLLGNPSRMISADQDQGEQVDVPSIESMRVKEMQAELKQRKVAYEDCFDKDSLIARLLQARETTSIRSQDDEVVATEPSPKSEDSNNQRSSSSSAQTEASAKNNNNNQTFDRESNLEELRSMRVRELREECAKRRIRWAQFIEKEDLVQALLTARASAADFSVSGIMSPGQVTDFTGDQLEQELSQPSKAPLLLDVYATWCGPCQMMAPQLEAAAAELGDRCRVGKLDSDKYPTWAAKLKAGGLPTVLVLNGDDELQRIEGALMKDQILQFMEPHVV